MIQKKREYTKTGKEHRLNYLSIDKTEGIKQELNEMLRLQQMLKLLQVERL